MAIAEWGKRAGELLIASLALVLLSPMFVTISLALRLNGSPILHFKSRIGRWSVPFSVMEFNTSSGFGKQLRRTGLHRLPSLMQVVLGQMSLVGPRALRPESLNVRERLARKRSSVRPGLISLWWLRSKANINFGSEQDVELNYIDQQSLSGDLGIALRALPSLFYGGSSAKAPDRVDILGIPIDNLTMEETLQYILETASGNTARRICFVNTDCVNKSVTDPPYLQNLRASDLVLADGIGIRLAGKILRREIRQNVNGTDLFPLLCKNLQASEAGLFLLGSRPGVAEAVDEWIKKNYPGVQVKGFRDGYFEATQEAEVVHSIRASGAQILLVAFGSPRQDLWIAEHLAALGVGVAMGVGGLFDFYSGRIPRAPQWMRELSLEWMFRLYQEPQRMWRRYLVGNAIFLSRVVLAAWFCWPATKRAGAGGK